MKNKAPWNSLEHKVHRVLKHHNIQQQHMLLAVSGGIDSMVLLECFDRLQQALRLSLTVAHVHHGPVNHGPVNDPHAHPTNYRDRVSLLVQQLCEHKKLNFITNYKINNTTENKNLCFNTTQKSAVNNQVDKNLSGPQMAHSQIVPVDNKTQAQSEEALRGFRYQCFKEFQTATNAQHNQARFNTSSGRLDGESFNLWPRPLIVLAHHQDDLIETRLIRLLRGTGAQGLKAMQVFDAPLLRPFLDVSKKQIIEYAQQRQLKWLDDPCGDNFRQWLRRVWLPSLEQKRPGSSQALGRSLQLLVEAAQPRANTVAGSNEAANSINNSTSHNGAKYKYKYKYSADFNASLFIHFKSCGAKNLHRAVYVATGFA